jgi:hypothetical protein
MFYTFSIEPMQVFFPLENKWGFEGDGMKRYPMVLGSYNIIIRRLK